RPAEPPALIAAASGVRVAPDGSVREDAGEGRDLALDDVFRALVQRHPLRQDTARVQVRLDELEVLLRVERRSTLDPRMNRVRRDDVELLVRRQNVMPRVVVDDLHPRVVYDVVVLLLQVQPG